MRQKLACHLYKTEFFVVNYLQVVTVLWVIMFFCDWQHASCYLSRHEKYLEHIQNFKKWTDLINIGTL